MALNITGILLLQRQAHAYTLLGLCATCAQRKFVKTYLVFVSFLSLARGGSTGGMPTSLSSLTSQEGPLFATLLSFSILAASTFLLEIKFVMFLVVYTLTYNRSSRWMQEGVNMGKGNGGLRAGWEKVHRCRPRLRKRERY